MATEPDLLRNVNAKLASEEMGKIAATCDRTFEPSVRQETPLRHDVHHVFGAVDGNVVDVSQSHAVFVETIFDSADRKAVGVFDAVQSFLFDCGNDLSVTQQKGGAVVHRKADTIVFIVTFSTTVYP
jgi:hypothetical protein